MVTLREKAQWTKTPEAARRLQALGFVALARRFVVAGWGIALLVLLLVSQGEAETIINDQGPTFSKPGLSGGSGGGEGSKTALPDLFSGSLSYAVPIEVPPGRKGMDPGVSLIYQSSAGNGLVGLGWELEVGAIERTTPFGVLYSDDRYTFRSGGGAIELINIGSNEYRAKIEGGFTRFRKLNAADGRPYWEATDRAGTRYLFGHSSDSRQDDPGNANVIFRWGLTRVQDPNGNFMTVKYIKDRGQIYLDQIDYAGNATLQPTNRVTFSWESRTDKPTLYTLGFPVTTAYRLKAIDIFANGDRVRKYELQYAYSGITGRSLLQSVIQYGNNGSSHLPETTFAYQGDAGNAVIQQRWLIDSFGSSNTFANSPRYFVGDFTGDGKTDLLWHGGNDGVWVARSGAPRFYPANWLPTGFGNSDFLANRARYFTGDFTGDGKTDFLWHNGDAGVYVARSTGSGFAQEQWASGFGDTDMIANAPRYFVGDFNGDGRNDLLWHGGNNGVWVARSTGNAFVRENWLPGGFGNSDFLANRARYFVGDFNGDGKTDLLWHNGDGGVFVARSTGSGFAQEQWLPSFGNSDVIANTARYFVADFNGDSKADFLWHAGDGGVYVALSTGSSFVSSTDNWFPGGFGNSDVIANRARYFFGDFTGDGKTDILWHGGNAGVLVARSTGSAFLQENWLPDGFINDDVIGNSVRYFVGDFNGDGRTSLLWNGGSAGVYVALVHSPVPDLLNSINNGLNGTSYIEYTPSTSVVTGQQTQLPFPIHTVSTMETCADGFFECSTRIYSYSGGYYSLTDRDFRGFAIVRVIEGVGQEILVTTTRFHQGNDTAVDANDPNVPVAYMKGKPYRVTVRDEQNQLIAETTTEYVPNNSVPYFNPPVQIDSTFCDSGSCGKRTRIVYQYDAYGNVIKENQYGNTDHLNDDRTVIRAYSPNTTAWILGLPRSETVYQGLGTVTTLAATDYFYDEVTSCDTASTTRIPTKGNLTRILRWLSDGTSPEVRTAHDGYGNVICTRDANGNVTTITYDKSATLPTVVTNPLGHTTTTQYYGVDSVPADTGLYGQVKGITDANKTTTTTQYDALGRKSLDTSPDGSWTRYFYNTFGFGVGDNGQHIRTDTSSGLSSWTYFDGLGRTVLTKKTGPDSKLIITQVQYDSRGLAVGVSLPYFNGASFASILWRTMTYDLVGRLVSETNPDGSRALRCYRDWTTVTIDANNHRRRETQDSSGRIVKVEEYLGGGSTCTTDVGTPYATTSYQYDLLGNLLTVTDAKSNVTEIQYDTLSRKRFMHDPDAGDWSYDYDLAGNLVRQVDARGQIITLTYDVINRLTRKTLPEGKQLRYLYDKRKYGRGRLSEVKDLSGSTIFTYDALGRAIKEQMKVFPVVLPGRSTKYLTEAAYDGIGRVMSVRYPDKTTVNYGYNGPLLERVYDSGQVYIAYSGFNALGQPARVTFGNGVVTDYTYSNAVNSACPEPNSRLCTATTRGSTGTYQDFRYRYDPTGSVLSIADPFGGDQTFQYDELNRLVSASGPYGGATFAYDAIGNLTCNAIYGQCSAANPNYSYPPSGSLTAKPHAVSHAGADTFTYDANGNMLSGAGRTFTYDPENRPLSISTNQGVTDFVYNSDGMRVIKTTGAATTTYVGKFYECTDGQCTKYILAGDQRIARRAVGSNEVLYYHADHLGSGSVVTNSAAARVLHLSYYPFGKTRLQEGSVDIPHKYTGQELDDSTDLYYYGARYYDPVLGRFIQADRLVPNFADPQSLNRYTYARGNPVLYTDPEGNFFWIPIIVGAIAGAISAGEASDWDLQTTLTGAFIGGVAGAAGAGVGGWVASANIAGAGILGGVAGGAAGGAVGGGLTAAFFGGDIGQAMLQGAAWGAVAGGLTSGFVAAGAPNPLASAGVSQFLARAQGGDSWRAGRYGLYASLLGNLLVMNGVDADGVVPAKGSKAWQRIYKTNDTFVTTPKYDSRFGEYLESLGIALLTNGTSHAWHAKDGVALTPDDFPYVPEGHYYHRVTSNVPRPGEAYNYGPNYDLFTNNCTTRLGGAFAPFQYYGQYQYGGFPFFPSW